MSRSLSVCLFVAAALMARASEKIEILPSHVTLHGRSAHQRLVAEKVQSKQYVGEITNAVFVSSNPKVVRIKNGVAVPVGNGKATVSLKNGKGSTEVTVEAMDKPFQWSFRNHVQSVLTKSGCNSGACHGAAAGQNGFKLSLRGYDDEGDFLTLTRSALGRRVIPTDPARSLMLLKPTKAVPHKGGRRFDTNSIDYKVISEWIASGTPAPKAEDPRIQKIEFVPSNVILKNGDQQQLMVIATFSDGHTEEVTHWVKFNAANGTVTQVDDEGKVKVIGNGEGAITAWYLSHIAAATVTVPFTNKLSRAVFAKAKRRNFIDDLVNEKLRNLNIPPSPRCTDGEFIRRAYIDTIGVLPTEKETRDFLTNKSSKKRDQLIERLLQRPEYVDYWSHKWSDLLLVSTKKLKAPAMWSYYNWIRENVAANTHWDDFARKIVTATGSTFQNGAGNFYILHDDPKSLIETTSQAFLGMSVACAKCHNHPMEKWTNDQYYKFANLYARVRAKSGNGEGEAIVYTVTQGDIVQPLTGKPQVPAPLDGKPLPIDSPEDRRKALADWLVARDNPYFSRAIVNRVWANFFGVGLVEAVDDLRVTNPASNEKLLSATAKFLADQKFDLKVLMRTILQSETYQRSSEPLPENIADTRFYSRYYPRRMMAEVLLDAVSEVTDTYGSINFAGITQDYGGQSVPFPKGWRAMQLPDTRVNSDFLKTFGRPDRTSTCECERTSDPSISQVLTVCNGDTMNKKLEMKNNEIGQLLAKKTPPEKMLEHAYLTALCRFPTEPEKKKEISVLNETKPDELRPAVEDMYWALLSSREFMFNH